MYMLCKNGDELAYRAFPYSDKLVSEGLVNIIPTAHETIASPSLFTLTTSTPSHLTCTQYSDGVTYLHQRNFVSCLKRNAEGHYKLSESINFLFFSEAEKAAFPIDFGTPFNGSFNTGDYTIKGVFINRLDANGLFVSLNNSEIFMRFEFVSILKFRESHNEEESTKTTDIGLIASKIFSYNNITVEVQRCSIGVNGVGVKAGLVAGSILGYKNTISVQVTEHLSMTVMYGAFSRVGGVFGSAHDAENVYKVKIEKLSMNVGGNGSYVGGIGGLVENNNEHRNSTTVIHVSEAQINHITISTMTPYGVVGAFFWKMGRKNAHSRYVSSRSCCDWCNGIERTHRFSRGYSGCK